jgi:hypothetical protein
VRDSLAPTNVKRLSGILGSSLILQDSSAGFC